MTSDIRLAFENLEARADASSPDGPRDRISLRDHIVEVEIGAFQAERGSTQRICFNVVVEVRTHTKPVQDDVDRILSYDTITEAITSELADERLNLLETLAERIADQILLADQAERVFVRIEKLDRGPGALGVEIVRSAVPEGPQATEHAVDLHIHPVIVYLSNAAIASPHLTGWLDQLTAMDDPVTLCVGPPETTAPSSAVAPAQRRIDLLAIEQNAWVLAGRDPRCVVMGSRTELEWAARHGQMSVWAPSKIVLDAVEGPSVQPKDALALVCWFSETIDAKELIVVDTDPPQTHSLPVRNISLQQEQLF